MLFTLDFPTITLSPFSRRLTLHLTRTSMYIDRTSWSGGRIILSILYMW